MLSVVDIFVLCGVVGNWLLDLDDIMIGNVLFWGLFFSIDVDLVVLINVLNSGSVIVKMILYSSLGYGDIIIFDFIGVVSDYNNGGFGYNWISGSMLILSVYCDIYFVIISGVLNVVDLMG